jgi:hypothetical protein
MSLAKSLVILPLALGVLFVPAASPQVRSATITGAVTHESGVVAANAEVFITNSGTNAPVAGFVPFRETGLAIATGQTARLDMTNATDAEVTNDVPNVMQNPLFYAVLQNGVQPRNETSTTTLGDL